MTVSKSPSRAASRIRERPRFASFAPHVAPGRCGPHARPDVFRGAHPRSLHPRAVASMRHAVARANGSHGSRRGGVRVTPEHVTIRRVECQDATRVAFATPIVHYAHHIPHDAVMAVMIDQCKAPRLESSFEPARLGETGRRRSGDEARWITSGPAARDTFSSDRVSGGRCGCRSYGPWGG
jgi:hypothetical protein